MRSLLFAPATKPELGKKLGARGADAVVLDLEDAVPPGAKSAARDLAQEMAAGALASAPDLRLFVRVNPPATEWFAEDVRDALAPGLAGVVVPKVETAADVHSVAGSLRDADRHELDIVAGIETARGVLNAVEIAAAGVTAAYFGAEDFIADIGGVRTRESQEVLYARSRVVLAARCAGIAAIDQAFLDFHDDAGFRRDAEAGRALGYRGKICIHPGQVPLAHAAMSPSGEELERARRLILAWQKQADGNVGAFEFEGAMVDEPALKMARQIVQASTKMSNCKSAGSPSA